MPHRLLSVLFCSWGDRDGGRKQGRRFRQQGCSLRPAVSWLPVNGVMAQGQSPTVHLAGFLRRELSVIVAVRSLRENQEKVRGQWCEDFRVIRQHRRVRRERSAWPSHHDSTVRQEQERAVGA